MFIFPKPVLCTRNVTEARHQITDNEGRVSVCPWLLKADKHVRKGLIKFIEKRDLESAASRHQVWVAWHQRGLKRRIPLCSWVSERESWRVEPSSENGILDWADKLSFSWNRIEPAGEPSLENRMLGSEASWRAGLSLEFGIPENLREGLHQEYWIGWEPTSWAFCVVLEGAGDRSFRPTWGY